MSKIMTMLLAFGFLLMAHPVLGAGKQEEQNKRIVREFYEKGINQKDFEAASKYMGARYTQHNPMAADGPAGLRPILEIPSREIPELAQRDQTGVRRWRLCDPARARHTRARHARQRHCRHLQAGERQGRGALGCDSGDTGKNCEYERDVLKAIRRNRIIAVGKAAAISPVPWRTAEATPRPAVRSAFRFLPSDISFRDRRHARYPALYADSLTRDQNFWLLLNRPEAPLGAGGMTSTICGVLLPS